MVEPPDAESRALRRRVAWLAAATNVSRVALADPRDDVRRLATTEAGQAARADTASLVFPTAEPTELTNVVTVGLGAEVYEDATFLARDSALGRAIVAGEALVVGEILPWATDHDDPPNPMRLGPAMTIPLLDPQGRNAAFVLSRTVDRAPFDADEHRFAAPFAELVSLALRYPDGRPAPMTPPERAVRDRALQVLHDDLVQRLFAVGVGLQSVVDRSDDAEAIRRLRGHVGDLDEMIDELRREGVDDPRPPTPHA